MHESIKRKSWKLKTKENRKENASLVVIFLGSWANAPKNVVIWPSVRVIVFNGQWIQIKFFKKTRDPRSAMLSVLMLCSFTTRGHCWQRVWGTNATASCWAVFVCLFSACLCPSWVRPRLRLECSSPGLSLTWVPAVRPLVSVFTVKRKCLCPS